MIGIITFSVDCDNSEKGKGKSVHYNFAVLSASIHQLSTRIAEVFFTFVAKMCTRQYVNLYDVGVAASADYKLQTKRD